MQSNQSQKQFTKYLHITNQKRLNKKRGARIMRTPREYQDKVQAPLCKFYQGNTELPIKNLSTFLAAPRPSLIAQTTKD